MIGALKLANSNLGNLSNIQTTQYILDQQWSNATTKHKLISL